MGRIIKKRVGDCDILIKEINGRITFKCKNRKKAPTAQDILESIKNDKIIFK